MSFDPYNRTSELDETALTAMAERLESRGRDPAFLGMLDDYLAAMDLGRISLVLDVGCGTGVAARRLARLGAFAGRIVGIDRMTPPPWALLSLRPCVGGVEPA